MYNYHVWGFFASPTNTDPWIHQQLFVGRLAGSNAPNSAKKSGAVTNTDLSQSWYKTIRMTVHKIATTKKCGDQPLFRAVAHWVVSIRMTHGQLCILYLCSDWMLWWGEGGEDSHTARKIVMRSNIPICHIWELLSDHLRCYINYLQNWYFIGLLEVWYKVADID